jgi:PKD repeat protein
VFQDIDRRPQPDFRAQNQRRACHPHRVIFENTSDRSLAYEWNFGDGTTSNAPNPEHTYTAPGNYSVTLVATNQYGERSLLRAGYIQVDGPLVDFQIHDDRALPGEPIQFTEAVQTTNPPLAFTWNFGDGIFSSAPNPRHAYAQTGIYGVSLTAVDPAGCRDTLEKVAAVTISPTDDAAKDGQEVSLYPNPLQAGGDLHLTVPEGTGSLTWQLTDVHGRRAAGGRTPGTGARRTLRLPPGLSAGVYVLRLGQDHRPTIWTQRLLVR